MRGCASRALHRLCRTRCGYLMPTALLLAQEGVSALSCCTAGRPCRPCRPVAAAPFAQPLPLRHPFIRGLARANERLAYRVPHTQRTRCGARLDQFLQHARAARKSRGPRLRGGRPGLCTKPAGRDPRKHIQNAGTVGHIPSQGCARQAGPTPTYRGRQAGREDGCAVVSRGCRVQKVGRPPARPPAGRAPAQACTWSRRAALGGAVDVARGVGVLVLEEWGSLLGERTARSYGPARGQGGTRCGLRRAVQVGSSAAVQRYSRAV